jgi:hypothetical protein
MEDSDIFDKMKIKLMSYVNYIKLSRYSFVRKSNTKYHYLDSYTDKEVTFSYRLPTFYDYNEYLILVY